MFNSVGERLPIKQLIATQIEDAILSKKFTPGQKLPSENELCIQFSVSRTSVREALQILGAHGLITVEKGKGIFVNKITSESVVNPLEKYLRHSLDRNYVFDLVHARQILEPSIAREAAISHDLEDIKLLDEDIKNLEQKNLNYKQLATIDMDFHNHLAMATKNTVVPLLLKPLHRLLPQIKSTVYATVDEARESAIKWHSKILTAVKDRDQEASYNFMVEHLKIAEKHASMILQMQDKAS
ncbi:MAG: FadR family transcriptional regulator [Melioribacteraceae bacterium]|nr:FadR family transcriptional regulator [Melioribacteraceae bacterium]MCF8265140.1 FadR family transcriptional regulator [Melioribacteraceae bacterium]